MILEIWQYLCTHTWLLAAKVFAQSVDIKPDGDESRWRL
jgi:hypothetical protein